LTLLPLPFTLLALTLLVVEGVVIKNTAGFEKTIQIMAAQSEDLSRLIVGQPMLAATFGDQRFEGGARKVSALSELAGDLVRQLQFDLHAGSLREKATAFGKAATLDYIQYRHSPVINTYTDRHPFVTACARMQLARFFVRHIHQL